MLFDQLIDERTVLAIHTDNDSTYDPPDSMFPGLDEPLVNEVKVAFRSILKSACTTQAEVERDCNSVNSNLYNKIDVPYHFRAQHMVLTISRDMKFSFSSKSLID